MEEQDQVSRRAFLRVMGAAVAAGTLSGCRRGEKKQIKGLFKPGRKAEKRARKEEKRRMKEEKKAAEAEAEKAQEATVERDRIEAELRAEPVVSKAKQTRGVYGFKTGFDIFKGKNVEEIARQLYEWGVNAVWTDTRTLSDKALVEALHAWQVKVYTTVGMFSGWHQRNRPIKADGTPLQSYVPGHWYQGSCPNQPDDITRKLGEIREVAKRYDIDGLWLDAIRYPTFWETPKPNAAMMCFESVCLAKFQKWSGIVIPEENLSVRDKAEWILKNQEKQWVQFKMDAITDIVRQCAEALKSEKPTAMLGVFSVPWRRSETRGGQMNAIERVIAQDYPRLAKYVDVFSPMVYHRMCGEPVRWIGEVVDWIAAETRKPVWPVVQAHGEPKCEWNPYRLPEEEFADSLRVARAGASSGVLVFTLDSVLKDQKLKPMAENFRSV